MRELVDNIRKHAVHGWYSDDLPRMDDPDYFWEISAEWRREYVAIKYAISYVLKPKRICEIGVYSGISALCFLGASPKADYVGIDNLSGRMAADMVPKTQETLDRLGYKNDIIITNSQEMKELPGTFDLIHVDGDHSLDGTLHDVTMAWKALRPRGYLLVDNGHDRNVIAGTFDALWERNGSLLQWAYFEHAVGNILIRRDA